jgi:hypothetical protein
MGLLYFFTFYFQLCLSAYLAKRKHKVTPVHMTHENQGENGANILVWRTRVKTRGMSPIVEQIWKNDKLKHFRKQRPPWRSTKTFCTFKISNSFAVEVKLSVDLSPQNVRLSLSTSFFYWTHIPFCVYIIRFMLYCNRVSLMPPSVSSATGCPSNCS